MARGTNQQLAGGRELVNITQKDTYAGALFARIINAVNSVAKNSNVAAVGKITPPDPIDAINVAGAMDATANTITCPGEILHYTLTHNSTVSKGIRYISEIDTNPNFTQPHVIDHGCSRSAFINLPANDNNNVPQTYYLRSYPQHVGSDAQKPTVLGGLHGATKIVMTGSTQQTLVASTGSGTAAANGQQGGKGLGTVLTRPAPGPKRNLLP